MKKYRMFGVLLSVVVPLVISAQTTTFTSNLTVGSRGAQVTALQQILASKGFLTVAPTGYFGSITKAAVAAWQASAGLPSTGFFGPLSRGKIGPSVAVGTTGTPGCPAGAMFNTQTGASCINLKPVSSSDQSININSIVHTGVFIFGSDIQTEQVTVNPDGSGSTGSLRGQIPSSILDYQKLLQSILSLPSITFTSNTECLSSLTVTFQGNTSSNLDCIPTSSPYQTLATNAKLVLQESVCFGSGNAEGCPTPQQNETGGISVGVTVQPIPDCQQASNIPPGESHPCATSGYNATFAISKSDGTFIKNASTNSNDLFEVFLPPGNYVLTDISAGLSQSPHPFFNGNATFSSSTEATSYSFTVSPGKIDYVGAIFDGNTF